MTRPALIPFFVLCLAGSALGQNFKPPEPIKPTEEQLRAIQTKLNKLAADVAGLRREGVRDPQLADIEIFGKAAEWVVKHGEFYKKEYIDYTLEALDRGLLRSAQVKSGESPWFNIPGASVVHGVRSRVDGSVQPYAVSFPHDYAQAPEKRYRLDIVLHGRNSSLTEVSFLHQHNGDKPIPKDRSYIQIDIYGRGNNAYRWAGETDVLEVIEHFFTIEKMAGRETLIDPARMVLRGFSMGGAGTWHLGLHRPDRFCVIGPGAGFTTTRGYLKDLPEKLPDHIEKCLRIYDAADYAENVFNVPVVAFSGDKDPQIKAARNIEERLKGTDLSITHLVAPGLGHVFPTEWSDKAEAEYARHVRKGRSDGAKRVRFVTWTLKYHRCDWVEILGLEKHYDKAVVDAEQTEEGFKITTKNVRGLHLTLSPGEPRERIVVEIDGRSIQTLPYRTARGGEPNLYLQKVDGNWKSVPPQKIIVDQLRKMQKSPGLQGPIDDAFTSGFICVRGTGRPWSPETHAYAEANLKRFQLEWDKHMRGSLAVKDDVNVTVEDIASRNLILFGDPGSNRLIAQMLDALPIAWTEKKVVVGDASGDAATHVPVLIHPSPLNVERYVVLNSGHTFRAADFVGTNALLYPRLGDHALLKLAPTKDDPLAVEVVSAGLFDEFWKFNKK